ncbi:hypothetical protein PENTCL1PPCAC_25176, partial [Pristionchus entomophagus]
PTTPRRWRPSSSRRSSCASKRTLRARRSRRCRRILSSTARRTREVMPSSLDLPMVTIPSRRRSPAQCSKEAEGSKD